MRAVQVTRRGDPAAVVEVRDVEVPEPGPGEVRVKVGAASINFGDIARTRGGVATVQTEPPFTLGMDVCGVVDAAGAGADHLLGRRVVATTKQSIGGMAENAICGLFGAFDAPPGLDDHEAAGFLLPFHTSYLALHTKALVQSGETVVITGAASGVGTAAVQIAAAAGADVIALTSGAEHAEHCRANGAGTVIDYRTDDVFERLMDHTADAGVPVVLDLVGGDLTDVLWTCMAAGGRYVPAGFNDDPAGGTGGKPLRRVSMANFSVLGLMLSYNPAPRMLRKMGLQPLPPSTGVAVHSALTDLIDRGAIRPTVQRRVTMDQVGATLADHENRRATGRSVVTIG